MSGLQKTQDQVADYWFDVCPAAMVITDYGARIIKCNRYALGLLGVASADELAGRKIAEYIAPETSTALERGIEQARIHGRGEACCRLVTDTGQWTRWHLHIGYRSADNDQKGGFVILVTRAAEYREHASLAGHMQNLEGHLDRGPLLLLTLDKQGRVTFINDSGCELLGCEKEEAVASDWIESFLPARIRKDMRNKLHRFTAGELETSGYYENPVLTSSGEERLLAWHNTLLRDAAGCVAGIVCSGVDITERIRAEDQLRSSEERLKILFEYAPDGYYLSDMKGRFVDGNRAAEKIIGYSRDELIGKSFLKLNILPRSQISRAAKLLAKNIRGKPTGPDELILRHKDGTHVTVEIRTFPVRIEDRMLVLGIARDVSARRKVELQLRRSERRYRELVENLDAVIYTTDGFGVITYVSPAAEMILGAVPDDCAGKPFVRLIHQDDRQRYQGLEESVLRGHAGCLECRTMSPDGTQRWVQICSRPISEDDRIVGIQGVLSDTTDSKVAEEALQKANADLQDAIRQLERSNQELRDFAHAAAHDLKSPLRGVGTIIDWIASDYADTFDDYGKTQLGLVRGRVARMADLIEGILRYSEIGRFVHQKEDVDTGAVVRSVASSGLVPDGFEFIVNGSFPTVRCQKAHVRCVFESLIANAVAYMDKQHGRITVACTEEQGHWRFSIADNGPGIDPKYFDRIFKMFQTLAPRDEIESSGVGLALVRKIVEMWGGSIWVESNVGMGSTFSFTLPKAVASEDVSHPSQTRYEAGGQSDPAGPPQ